jgi:hypothetical protein
LGHRSGSPFNLGFSRFTENNLGLTRLTDGYGYDLTYR